MNSVFACTVPKPECEAVIIHEDISWPIRSESEAYTLAKRLGAPGFWRMKARRSA